MADRSMKNEGTDKNNRNRRTAPEDDTSCYETVCYQNMGFQYQVRLFYDSTPVQYFFTFLILVNFVIILISATSWAIENDDVHADLKSVDRIFVYIFLAELIINLYGNWFWHFWQVSRWNWFDFIVITLSLASPVMSAIRVARVVRLLRVLRVAGKLQSLRTIISTFDRSMNSVAAVVALLLMLMCIYAVFGVHEYKIKDPENFGDIGKAMFTMFQLVTGENWPELARPLMYGRPAEGNPYAIKATSSAPIFFVSFMVIAALTTIEVVAAIFLDKMAEAKDYVKEAQALHLAEEKAKEDIIREKVLWVQRFNAKEINGGELKAELAKLDERERSIDDGHLNKDEIKEKVDKAKQMDLLGNMSQIAMQTIHTADRDGDGIIDREEMMHLSSRQKAFAKQYVGSDGRVDMNTINSAIDSSKARGSAIAVEMTAPVDNDNDLVVSDEMMRVLDKFSKKIDQIDVRLGRIEGQLGTRRGALLDA